MTSAEFRQLLAERGKTHWRDMPWRDDTRAYYVLVSELMLQQTQVARVVPKFMAFIERFADEKTLAAAELSEVLCLWQGLGYNRRAKFLHDAAKMIVHDFDGQFPRAEADTMRLPGVGKNTAGAIHAYAFNEPSIFVETNVRTVYIHHFFHDDFGVSDSAIIEKLTKTIDHKNPRKFYQNLMDYGAYLKTSGIKNNAQSKHYKKPPRLEGSLRQMRGMIIKQLSQQLSLDELASDPRFTPAIDGLVRDGLIERYQSRFRLTK